MLIEHTKICFYMKFKLDLLSMFLFAIFYLKRAKKSQQRQKRYRTIKKGTQAETLFLISAGLGTFMHLSSHTVDAIKKLCFLLQQDLWKPPNTVRS